MSTAEVRAATVGDAEEIARIQRETWNAAYADILGKHALAELDASDAEHQWIAAVEHPETRVYVALEGDFVVGYSAAGPSPAEETANADGDLPEDVDEVGLIASVIVEPRWGRRGHGGRLLATAANELYSLGARRGISWVAQADSASLALFRKAGWNPDGLVRTLDTGERLLKEIRLTGPLDLELS
jgi:L-amino acid N-acyltransferase YncA